VSSVTEIGKGDGVAVGLGEGEGVAVGVGDGDGLGVGGFCPWRYRKEAADATMIIAIRAMAIR